MTRFLAVYARFVASFGTILLVADAYTTGNTVLDTLRREMAARLELRQPAAIADAKSRPPR